MEAVSSLGYDSLKFHTGMGGRRGRGDEEPGPLRHYVGGRTGRVGYYVGPSLSRQGVEYG